MNLVTALDMQEYAPTASGDAAEKEMVVDSTGAPLDTTETTDAAEAEAVVTDGEMQQVEEETEQLETTADTVGAIEDEVADSIVDSGDAIEAEIPETTDEQIPEEQKVVAQENYFMQTTLAHAMRCVGVTTMATCESRSSLRSNLALTQESIKEAVAAGIEKLWQKIKELIASITDRAAKYRAKLKAFVGKLKPSVEIDLNEENRRVLVALDNQHLYDPEKGFDHAQEFAKIVMDRTNPATNIDEALAGKWEYFFKLSQANRAEMLRQHGDKMTWSEKQLYKVNPTWINAKVLYLLDVVENAQKWLDKAGKWVKARVGKPQMESNDNAEIDAGDASGESPTGRMSKLIALVRAAVNLLFTHIRYGYGWLKIAVFTGAKMVMSTVGRK